MNYLIDFDTRSVECKGEDAEVLASYILDNDLNIAVALVSSEDDLASQFSLPELSDLYHNISKLYHNGREREFDDIEHATEQAWNMIINSKDEFPLFTVSLGKKLLKAGKARSKDKPEKLVKERKSRKATNVSSKNKDDTVVCLGVKPKASTMPFWIWTIVDDNLGEMSIGEIVAERENDWCEKQCRAQITRCLRKGFLIRQEEEL